MKWRAAIDRLLRREDPWIWPLVFWVLTDDEGAVGALVFLGVSDMFWCSHRVVALAPGARVHDPAFWNEGFYQATVVSAWSGAQAHTFPSLRVRDAAAPVTVLEMRSLVPQASAKPDRGASAKALRRRHQEALECALIGPPQHG